MTAILRSRWLIAAALILVGLALTAHFGSRFVSSYREMEYIRQQGIGRREATVDAIRPWMTLRFIAAAYAVPEEFLYTYLDIPFDRRDANRSLRDLERSAPQEQPAAGYDETPIDRVKAAVIAYREDPVVTGLRDVRPWMSMRYIANSTGVPTEYLFTKVGIPMSDNEYKPLDLVSEETKYPGGPRELMHSIQNALDEYEGQ